MANQKFPQVGLRAVFELTAFNKSYTQYQRNLRDIDRATKQAAQNVSRSGQAMGDAVAGSFDELVQQSQTLQDLLQALPVTALNELRNAFDGLGEGVGVNAQRFDELIQNGATLEDALNQSAQAMDAAGDAAGGLGTQLLTVASAGAIVVTSLTASIRLVQQSVSEYNELAEATRRLRYQTGLLSQEASSWVQVVTAAGVSTATAERGLSQFLSRIGDLRREQLLGEESTGDFSEAMDTLGVSVSNADGTLKTTEQLLAEVEQAFKGLGPGVQSAQVATDLFGRTGRQLLPILTDQNSSLADYQKTLVGFGATLSALDQKEYEQFLQAQFELRAALQGVFNYIARQWIPVLTQIQRIIANAVSIWRTFVGIMSGTEIAARGLAAELEATADTLEKINAFMQKVARATQIFRDILDPAAAASRALTRAEEERAQAMARASTAAAEARVIEEKRQEAIQDALTGLSEIAAQYNSKLADIEQDAAQKWADILVNRQRDAFDRAKRVTYQLIDLQAAYRERLDSIEADFAKRWEDILVNRQRDALIRGIQLAQRYEDLARNAERSRLDAIRNAQERGAELRRDANRQLEDVERDAQRRREELEREHQRRIRDIRQQFIDTATEAARRNDAVAVARAQRQRARELRDERQRYTDERSDLERALQEKRQDIERDRQEREQDHRDELARTLQRIQENYAQQRADLERQNQQERLIRAIRYQWELDDFNAAKAEQLAAADEWRAKQLADMQEAYDREERERRIQYQREKDDFDAAWRERLADAEEWYQEERDALAAHLNLTGQQLEAIYAEWAQEAAEAAAMVARATADALASEIVRYQHLLNEAQRAQAQAYVTPGAGVPAPLPKKAYVDVGPWPPGAPVFSQAEGGVVQASSPTHIVMGDAGPETAVFMPGRAGSLNVNHSFGRMGVDINGLPGGMNADQVTNLFYALLTQVAKGVQVPRT